MLFSIIQPRVQGEKRPRFARKHDFNSRLLFPMSSGFTTLDLCVIFTSGRAGLVASLQTGSDISFFCLGFRTLRCWPHSKRERERGGGGGGERERERERSIPTDVCLVCSVTRLDRDGLCPLCLNMFFGDGNGFRVSFVLHKKCLKCYFYHV